MHHASTIRFLQHEQIDKQLWDECINNSVNRLIYGYSFYLDAMSPGWNALIAPGYEWVLPLTHKTKYGISYQYQPPFMQQLGVFARANVMVPWKVIIEQLQRRYRFAEVQWNYDTDAAAIGENVTTSPATNYILDLSAGYELIASAYSNDMRRNLRRGMKFNHQYQQEKNYHVAISAYRESYGSRMPHVTAKHYDAFAHVCVQAAEKFGFYCRKLVNEKAEVMAIALLLSDGRRLYNIMNTTTAEGRKTEANYVLFDAIIAEFSGRNMVLDFEGSDLPGVKTFYENFSPVNQPFYQVRYNDLPWPLKLLKK